MPVTIYGVLRNDYHSLIFRSFHVILVFPFIYDSTELDARFFVLISEMRKPEDAMKVSGLNKDFDSSCSPWIGRVVSSRLCHRVLYYLCRCHVKNLL